MGKDQYYEDIVNKLENLKLDGNLFENCITDIFKALYPTISPIPGGSDGGLDGGVS